jgi:hypothetical protein
MSGYQLDGNETFFVDYFPRSKKSHLWSFEVKDATISERWISVKVQFLDSLNTGKRTLIVNN